jgi:GNAT superfamily N-acetyltransferase
MEIRPIQFDEGSLRNYEALFAACFPPSDKFGVQALRWLYTQNPAGQAVGFDAWEGDTLAAHYVCVPALISHEGQSRRMLLSLNTATHPTFQGRGLFTKLAQTTYESAASLGFDAIHGVANANSTPGFIKKLGFQLVQPLEARVGLGSLRVDRQRLSDGAQFQRIWQLDHLRWRCANPVNAIRARSQNGCSQFLAPAKGHLLPVYAQLEEPGLADAAASRQAVASPARLFLGLYPKDACRYERYVEIPRKLRPSPLNFIFLPLQTHVPPLKTGAVQFSFLDFDAY